MSRQDAVQDTESAERIRVVDLYEAAPKIQTRAVDGRFVRLRAVLRYGFLIGLVALPWFTWDDRQAVLLDLPARQFHVLGITFFPQDFFLVAGMLICGAFALFTFTNWLGRVWCGYTCPQSVWFQMFIDIEQWIEGPRHRRIRQDAAPLSAAKAWMKTRKWLVWVALAAVTAISIVGLFVPIRTLLPDLATLDVGGWALFWLAFFFAATLIMGGIMREQVCIYMCPYARFQAAMFDPDTLIVSYDPHRGEPRGSRPRGIDPAERGLGDCIDCELCVQVCPVGIDIRDGLQYQCISCAHCIDACDGVMERMGYAPGLIAYTTERELEGKPPRRFRPRLAGYAVVLVAMIGLFATLGITRGIAELDVMRDRGALSRELFVEGTPWVENAYTLRIVNKSQDARTWRLAVENLPGVVTDAPASIEIGAGEVRTVPLRLRVPAAPDAPRFRDAAVLLRADDGTVVAREETPFVTPGPAS